MDTRLEFLMTTDERIITSVRSSNGAYMDGTFTKDMLKETLNSDVKIEEVYGDKAFLKNTL